MAFKMISQEWCPYHEAYREEYIVDTESDVASLPICCAGSFALVSDSGKVYIVNASGKWVEFGAGV
jgi:hypothetical protein